MNSITKRWVRGSLFFTLAVLLVAEGLFLFFMISSYYDGARRDMRARFINLEGELKSFATSSNQVKDLQLRRAVEQFEEKDKFELMLVDENGAIVSSSSGVIPVFEEVPRDIAMMLLPGAEEEGYYSGANAYGNEHIMALTVRTPYTTDGIVAMRLVTSLTVLNETIRNYAFISIGFLGIVVLASVVSGLYFIRSIVFPLQKIEATASDIAQGDFDTRIDIQRDDEIGSLCKTINHMAEELSRSERMKNEFISSVSHELRTPLTSIKGWAETVGNISNPDAPGFKRGVQIIAGETDRLYDMVEELLDFSRIQHGLVLQRELLDLAAEVEEAVLLSLQRTHSLDIRLAYEAPEAPVPVMADKNRVRQVMVNILDNAIKYSSAGGGITVELLCEAGNAFVAIRDEGQGIAPEDLENVKLKFYKGKGSVRGSGIGLAVVDEIMRLHEGALAITSEEGVGTEVTLRFPLFKGRQDDAGEVS